jgi:ATP-dependent DNA ligase
MEAQTSTKIPLGEEWMYEPKWDGFRCLAFRAGEDVYLQSKALKPLARYFPEMVASLRALRCDSVVLDGELVIPSDGTLSFDHLLLRIHPSARRVVQLAAEHPAVFVVFDLIVHPDRGSLVGETLERRRRALDALARRWDRNGPIRISPATRDAQVARRWLRELDGVDGVIAKRLDLPYRPGDRKAMRKVKRLRTADCVVGGFRYSSSGRGLGSLLLGLYDDAGLLHHVGFTSSLPAKLKVEATRLVEPLKGGTGFTGRAPGGPSRWSSARSAEWEPVHPELVVEVQYDHVSSGRFRHGTRFLRWRPDKAPGQCTFEQLAQPRRSSLELTE